MELAQYIDQTLLRLDVTKEEMAAFLEEAQPFSFASVCIPPCYVEFAKKHTKHKICSVVAFPLGYSADKAGEAAYLIEKGAEVIDMVVNLGHVKGGNFAAVEKEVRDVARLGTCLKVIIQSSLLTDEEIASTSKAVEAGGAQFVKTSTGHQGGATVHAVQLIRSVVSPEIGVKASGGIRDAETAHQMIDAGATRIGTSSGVKMCQAILSS